jgi:hypothetical protein
MLKKAGMEYLSLLITLMNGCGSESACFDHPFQIQLNYAPSDKQYLALAAEQIQCVMPRFGMDSACLSMHVCKRMGTVRLPE